MCVLTFDPNQLDGFSITRFILSRAWVRLPQSLPVGCRPVQECCNFSLPWSIESCCHVPEALGCVSLVDTWVLGKGLEMGHRGGGKEHLAGLMRSPLLMRFLRGLLEGPCIEAGAGVGRPLASTLRGLPLRHGGTHPASRVVRTYPRQSCPVGLG